ncbi:unnamed protein product [Mycena citricolor]|uniref:Uncharacterized protein n=1 Tax=Mycena citricolor TaxID=2018698 RepID=A0AAD2Q765_9AGAR|nr:unnamed protein product [Mycena citricolor]
MFWGPERAQPRSLFAASRSRESDGGGRGNDWKAFEILQGDAPVGEDTGLEGKYQFSPICDPGLFSRKMAHSTSDQQDCPSRLHVEPHGGTRNSQGGQQRPVASVSNPQMSNSIAELFWEDA